MALSRSSTQGVGSESPTRPALCRIDQVRHTLPTEHWSSRYEGPTSPQSAQRHRWVTVDRRLVQPTERERRIPKSQKRGFGAKER